MAKMGNNGVILDLSGYFGNAINVISIQQLDYVVLYRLRYPNHVTCAQIRQEITKISAKWGCGRA